MGREAPQVQKVQKVQRVVVAASLTRLGREGS